jgi:GntR family transcriptional regulator
MRETKQKDNAYEKVAAALRDRILGGELKPGCKLPTEYELGLEYGVSRITIRRALDILGEEHLISKHQGKGSFVSPNPTRRIPLFIDYARSVRTHAPNLRRKLRLWKWMVPPEEIARDLQLYRKERVFYCEREDILNGETVAFDRAYIVTAYAKRLSEEDLVRVDFNEIWPERNGFRIGACKQVVEAVEADPETAGLLSLPEGSPVLEGVEIYTDSEGRTIGLFDNFYHPKHISLISHFSWGSSE